MTSLELRRSCSAVKWKTTLEKPWSLAIAAWRSEGVAMLRMASSSGRRGSIPAASIPASSMQLAQKSPIRRSSEPGGPGLAAAFSRTVRSFSRFCSKSRLAEPQYDWSAGMGLAFSHPPLANW
jgi:hypothetical protein